MVVRLLPINHCQYLLFNCSKILNIIILVGYSWFGNKHVSQILIQYFMHAIKMWDQINTIFLFILFILFYFLLQSSTLGSETFINIYIIIHKVRVFSLYSAFFPHNYILTLNDFPGYLDFFFFMHASVGMIEISGCSSVRPSIRIQP